jgi:hypothetical protein
MKQYENYTSVISMPFTVQSSMDRHNTLCIYPDCYSNCHVPCSLKFALDPKVLTHCVIADKLEPPNCTACRHLVADHRHYNSIWKTENKTETIIDKTAEQKYNAAVKDSAARELAIIKLDEVIVAMKEDIAQATDDVGRLTQSYAQLSLSGSFTGLVKKSVQLLETNLETMRGNGTDSDMIRVVEESLEGMKEKLAVAEAAAIQARLNESFVGEFT